MMLTRGALPTRKLPVPLLRAMLARFAVDKVARLFGGARGPTRRPVCHGLKSR